MYQLKNVIPRYRSIRGLTLIEVLITLSLLVILSAASFPVFSKQISDIRLSNTAQTIIQQLRSAQQFARKTQTTTAISVIKTQAQWCLGRTSKLENPDCDCNVPGDCEHTTVFDQQNGITMLQARFAGQSSYTGFEAKRGLALINGSFRNGTIWLANQYESKRAIVVSRLGRIRTCLAGENQCPKAP